jgi:hypothetical protein
MAVAFIYRCPNTGLKVQGWIAEDPTERPAENYEPIACERKGVRGQRVVRPQTLLFRLPIAATGLLMR